MGVTYLGPILGSRLTLTSTELVTNWSGASVMFVVIPGSRGCQETIRYDPGGTLLKSTVAPDRVIETQRDGAT